MEAPIRITFRAVMAGGVGVIFLVAGGYLLFLPQTRTFGLGLIFVGVGMLSLGLTDGFTDYGRFGRVMYGIGIAGFCLGIPLAIYAFYYGGF